MAAVLRSTTAMTDFAPQLASSIESGPWSTTLDDNDVARCEQVSLGGEMKVYLDDERTTPEDAVRAYWPDEAIELLKSGDVTEISLDHDLGDDDRGTGYDVVLWIEEQVALHGFVPPAMKVHSANVSARTKMENGIRAIEEMVRKRDG